MINDRTVNLLQSRLALSRWENEGGAGPPHDRVAASAFERETPRWSAPMQILTSMIAATSEPGHTPEQKGPRDHARDPFEATSKGALP